MKHSTIFKIEYRARGYSEDDFVDLKATFQSLGFARFRGQHLPEAGGVTELWLVIEFIGLSAAAGIIGHIASKFYETLSVGLLKFIARKSKQDPIYPEFMSMRITYDDLDIVISLPDNQTIEKLKNIISVIEKHLTQRPLSENLVQYVAIPVEYTDGHWELLSIWNQKEYTLRYWGVGTWGTPGITDIYDVQECKLLNVPSGKLLM